MSERRHDRKRKEQGRAARPPRAKSAQARRADLPRQSTPNLHPTPDQLPWQAGNKAVTRLLEEQQSLDQQQPGGQPLAPQIESEMERAYNTDFSDIRLHDDSSARAQAEALDSIAFTRGDDIYLGPQSPAPDSPSGRALLAHELAHVVQQRRAARVEIDEVSPRNDAFEQSADHAAHLALQGQAANAHTGGVPPGIQRQPREGKSDVQDVARQALEDFLRRAHVAQGGRTLQVTQEVRDAVTNLFRDDAVRLAMIERWLDSSGLPGDPADFARVVAERLPLNVKSARIERLKHMPVHASGPTTRTQRVKKAIESSAPGSAEREEEKEAGRRARGETDRPRTRVSAGETTAPGERTAQERLEEQEQIGRTITGQKGSTTVGPFSVDILRLGRIFKALGRKDKPRAPAQPQTEARPSTKVDDAIKKISPTALVPAKARRTARAGNFPDAQILARDIARRLDVALQQGDKSIDLQLGDEYDREPEPDRDAVIAEVKRILLLVREGLPDKAASVRVNVFFGKGVVLVDLGQ